MAESGRAPVGTAHPFVGGALPQHVVQQLEVGQAGLQLDLEDEAGHVGYLHRQRQVELTSVQSLAEEFLLSNR